MKKHSTKNSQTESKSGIRNGFRFYFAAIIISIASGSTKNTAIFDVIDGVL